MSALPVKKQEKELNLSLGERISVLRSNRLFMMIFPFVTLLLIMLIFGVATEYRFFKPRVLKGILSQSAIVGICAIGVSFIYSNGNLDISIGSVLGMAATFGVMAYNATESFPVMLLVCVGSAVVLMLFNCTMSVVCHIKTITVAIVMTQIYSAITMILIGGAGKIEVSYDMVSAVEDTGFRYIVFLAYLAVCYVVYHMTKVGRTLRFLGGNENCAIQTGMSSGKATYISFLMAGLGVGLASVVSVVDVSSVSIETGSGMGMDVMLATVLGGMSIFGGARSNSYAGFLGAITVVALNKGLLMVGVPSAVIQGIRGVIFLVLVYLNSEREHLLPARVQF